MKRDLERSVTPVCSWWNDGKSCLWEPRRTGTMWVWMAALMLCFSYHFVMITCIRWCNSSTQVVDARGGPSLKITSRPKKIKSISKKVRPSQISRLQKELKRNSEFCVFGRFNGTHVFLKEFSCSHTCHIYVTPSRFVLPTRLRCPQHHLQCLSGSVSQLQQPVGRRLRHWAQPGIQPLPCFLISGPDLLEEVRQTLL